MRSRGIRLAKEDSMVVEGPILTANSHGDKFLCNSHVCFLFYRYTICLNSGLSQVRNKCHHKVDNISTSLHKGPKMQALLASGSGTRSKVTKDSTYTPLN